MQLEWRLNKSHPTKAAKGHPAIVGARQRHIAYAANCWEGVNAINSILMLRSANYVNDLNAIVGEVWESLQPREPMGRPRAGQITYKPCYGRVGEALMLYKAPWKYPRHLFNPVLIFESGSLKTMWRNEAWVAVVGEILGYLRDALQALDPDVDVSGVPWQLADLRAAGVIDV